MDWIYISVSCICTLSVIVNIAAISILSKNKFLRISPNQNILAISLCITDLFLSVTTIIRCLTIIFNYRTLFRDFFVLLQVILFGSMYFFLMMLLTLDRYIAIKLNIKYSIYCAAGKLKTAVFMALILLTIAFSVIFTTHIYRKYDVERFCVIYINSTEEALFVFAVVITYSAIYKKYRENKRSLKRIRNQIRKSINLPPIRHISASRFNIYTPTLIIVTFCIFTILPQIFRRILLLWNDAPEILHLGIAFYPFGWCSDPLIYMFSRRRQICTDHQRVSTKV